MNWPLIPGSFCEGGGGRGGGGEGGGRGLVPYSGYYSGIDYMYMYMYVQSFIMYSRKLTN